MKVVKILTPIPASPSVSTPFAFISVDSSVPYSESDLDLPKSERRDLGPRHFDPEPIALGVINEPEVEEGMTTDLRAGFKERHRKRLYETIDVIAPSPKRTRLEEVREEPMRGTSMMPVPSPDVAGSSNVSAAEKETYPTQDRALGGLAPVKKDLDQKDALAFDPLPTERK